jgi:hypothetical protein
MNPNKVLSWTSDIEIYASSIESIIGVVLLIFGLIGKSGNVITWGVFLLIFGKLDGVLGRISRLNIAGGLVLK